MSIINEDSKAILNEVTQKEKEDTGKCTSITFEKVSLFRIISYFFKLSTNKAFILLQISDFIFDFIDMFVPFVEGNILNAVTLEWNYENMIFWGKIRIMLLITQFSLIKLTKKFNISRDNCDITLQLKLNFYSEILKKEMEFHDNVPLEKIQKVYNENCDSINYFNPQRIIENYKNLFKLLISSFTLYYISYELLIIQLFIFASNIMYSYKILNVSWDEYNQLYKEKTTLFSEAFQNIKFIKTFSLENKISNIFKAVTKKVSEISTKNDNVYADYTKFSVGDSLILAQVIYGGKMILDGKLGIGDFNKFKLLAVQLNNASRSLFSFYKGFIKEYSKIETVFELMDYKRKENKEKLSHNTLIDENENKKVEFNGEIEFKNVNFRYPTRPKAQILNNLSFKISKGEVAAFVGSSGCGKSTVASLFHRLYDPENGEILIDNKNIKYLDIEFFHHKIGYVSQEPYLFTLSIKENILFGIDYSNYTQEAKQKLDLKLDEIINKANCGFVYDKSIFPDGLNTIVNGNSLSGGQKQRIAIARALMKEVNFLIFDEATSALDANSEHEVQKAIDEIIKEAKITTIIIAHRLSTIKNCSKIFVLNKGTVVEEGTHKELKRKNGFYKELIKKQLEAYEDQETLLKKKSTLIIN